jgi:hypothetical protein
MFKRLGDPYDMFHRLNRFGGGKKGSSSGILPTDIPLIEAQWLRWLYENTDGDNWTNNTNWLKTTTTSDWFGLTVLGAHLTRVDLNTNNLIGDIGGFHIEAFTQLDRMRLQTNDLTGNISGWTLPETLTLLYLFQTSLSGDISGWILPPMLEYLYLNETLVDGDISGWILPNTLMQLFLYTTGLSGDISSWILPSILEALLLFRTSLIGVPDLSSMANIQTIRVDNCALSQANVDTWVQDLYTRWLTGALTFATPTMNIAGTNAAPSGIYQNAAPPTTGKEFIFKLENDPDATGFNTWTITYNP